MHYTFINKGDSAILYQKFCKNFKGNIALLNLGEIKRFVNLLQTLRKVM